MHLQGWLGRKTLRHRLALSSAHLHPCSLTSRLPSQLPPFPLVPNSSTPRALYCKDLCSFPLGPKAASKVGTLICSPLHSQHPEKALGMGMRGSCLLNKKLPNKQHHTQLSSVDGGPQATCVSHENTEVGCQGLDTKKITGKTVKCKTQVTNRRGKSGAGGVQQK